MAYRRLSSAAYLFFVVLIGVMLAVVGADPTLAQRKGGKGGGKGGKNYTERVPEYFEGYDLDGDGHITAAEWNRRGNFERLDANRNGSIEYSEFRVMFESLGRKGPMTNPIRPASSPQMDSSVAADRVAADDISKRTTCGITRLRKCPDGNEIGEELGLFETGLGPAFPPHALCNGIDEFYAMDYTDKTGRGMHGGIDLPTDFGTPILAVAAGTVVGAFDGSGNARGRTIVLRHSPEDTGLPMWIFTEYAHLNEMPTHVVGQRVRMGEILGPTGNSGTNPGSMSASGNSRRPAIHFAVYYSDSRRFAEVPNYIIPENARWMDSNALYRKAGPYDSVSMKALPDAEKFVSIPIMYLDGKTEPANTKLIWPYACTRG